MAKLATMGTYSCAVIAIGYFKDDQIALNEAFIETGKSGKGAGKTVQEFYDDILYPTTQPLGQTANYPFEELMQTLEKSPMRNKFTIITLNKHQTQVKDGYWLKQLEKWGFVEIDQTKNNIGMLCYCYTRNIARPKGLKSTKYT